MTFDLLAGVRVLDLSQYLPGPHASQMMADFGADVVKMEPPSGDPLSRLNPVTGAVGRGMGQAYYDQINAGKRVLRLDLKTDEGRETFMRLIKVADVLLESYRPGVLERLGAGRTVLKRVNPRLIHCALSGYGQMGPDSARAGHDINYLARAGALSGTGPAERPVSPFPPNADLGGGMMAVSAILAALFQRARSGEGRFLDIALTDVMGSWQAWRRLAAKRQETAGREAELLNGGAACYRVYETADGGYLAVGALESKFWDAFCRTLGKPGWAARQYGPLPQITLIDDVAGVIRTRTLEDWTRIFDGVEACVTPVTEPGQVPSLEGAPIRIDGDAQTPRRAVRAASLDELLKAWD